MARTHHFEAIGTVNHEEDKVSDLANVNHGVEVIVAFDECQPSPLTTDDSDWSTNLVQGLFGIPADETPDESAFTDSGRTNNGDYDWRRLVVRSPVNQRDM